MESKTKEPLNLSLTPLPPKEVTLEIVYSQEYIDLLSSLPKDNGIVQSHSYQYQGFWYSPVLLKGLIDFQHHFQPRLNDIFLITTPKSGTTWMKAILYALINRDAHPPQNPDHPLLKRTPHELVPFVEFLKPSEYNSVPNSSDDSSTRIFTSHSPTVSLPKTLMEDGGSCNCKMVYMCRDIKDTFVSYFHFANKANLRSPTSLEETFDMYIKGLSSAGPVWDHILGYWKESIERPHRVLFMKYEELKNEPHSQLKRLANFIGKPFSQEEENFGLIDQIINLCSFDNMSKLDVNKTGHFEQFLSNSSFFRSGVVGDGKKYLSAEMSAKLDQITEEKFHGSGLCL